MKTPPSPSLPTLVYALIGTALAATGLIVVLLSAVTLQLSATGL